ncbi:HXXEE domain-containing protein [Paenibacillus sp. 1P03SA]|uniref:HXXEE domain-containing protein n=1 Tax=Paenibacillus sp. 1P03SA TaxID=3132294 RepID=UPI0039A0AEA4
MLIDDYISLNSVVWLFLAAFMIHDFEEIIFVEPWMKKNYKRLRPRVPGPWQRLFQEMSGVTSSQFAVAVFVEFILFVPVAYLAAERGIWALFIGFNALLFIHVFTHLGQSVLLRAYTPGVVTAVMVVLPYSVYLFYRLLRDGAATWQDLLVCAPSGLLLLPVVLAGHKLGKKVVPA